MSKKINQEFKDAQEYITPMLYKLSEGLCQRYNRSDYEDSIEIETLSMMVFFAVLIKLSDLMPTTLILKQINQSKHSTISLLFY